MTDKLKAAVVALAKGGKKAGKKSRKLGRNKGKCLAYRNHQTREKHKVVRVFKSSGEKAALKYATDHAVLAFAITRIRQFKAHPKG